MMKKIWDLQKKKGSLQATLAGHTQGVSTLLALSDGNLVSGSWDKKSKFGTHATSSAQSTLTTIGFCFSCYSRTAISLRAVQPIKALKSGTRSRAN
jgi:WD40 repeat protein